MTDRELLEKAAKAAGWTWWRSKHGYWNLTAPDGTQHTACHGWTTFNPHTGEAETEPTPGDALLEVGFCPLYTTQPRREEQEPVATVQRVQDLFIGYLEKSLPVGTPLYTAPQRREWVGLTDEEIEDAGQLTVEGERMLPYSFARAIEAKLREKNA